MYYKWIGAVLIVGSCTCFAFSITLHQIKEVRLLVALDAVLDNMISELSYQLTPLPVLIHHAEGSLPGNLRSVFSSFAEKLDSRIYPDALCCMESAIKDYPLNYSGIEGLLMNLGHSLGRFDLDGQLKGLASVQEQCRHTHTMLIKNQPDRLHSFRVLGICAGIALAILLI